MLIPASPNLKNAATAGYLAKSGCNRGKTLEIPAVWGVQLILINPSHKAPIQCHRPSIIKNLQVCCRRPKCALYKVLGAPSKFLGTQRVLKAGEINSNKGDISAAIWAAKLAIKVARNSKKRSRAPPDACILVLFASLVRR